MTVTGPTPRPARSAIRLLAALATLLASLTHGAALDWSGTVLVPANDGTPGGELIIRPPVGAQLPRVSVRLAGEELRMLRGSASEVRVQLPARTLSGPLVMTNLDTRLTGTLAPEFRVVSAPRTAAGPAPGPVSGGTISTGSTSTGSTQPRTLPASAPGGGSQQMSGNGYLLFRAGGEDAPVLFGEDNTQNNQGLFDVSAFLEVLEFSAALHTGQPRSHGSSQSTGHRVWHPTRFLVRVGKTTPWLFEAARTNKNIDLTLYLFHRHHVSGEVEQHFQYRISGGRIVSISLVKPRNQSAADIGLPYFVEFQVIPQIVEMESMTGGTLMVDNWSELGVR